MGSDNPKDQWNWPRAIVWAAFWLGLGLSAMNDGVVGFGYEVHNHGSCTDDR